MRYLFLLIFFSGYSQVFTYQGNVSDNGYPLPGATICVKGTTNCTSSDIDGNYSILVNKGDELVINFIGMQTVTLKVTGPNTNKAAVKSGNVVQPILSDAFSNSINRENDTLEVSVPSGTTPDYSDKKYAYADVALIKKSAGDVYHLKHKGEYNTLYLELFSEFITGQPIRQHHFQNSYAQGRSLNGEATYQGPETNEVFSWGPLVSTLQTSGTATPYYPNGAIISGVGNAVPLYNRNDFFRNTFEQKTTLSTRFVMRNRDYLKLNLGYRNSNVSLPTGKNDEVNATLAYHKHYDAHQISANINVNRYENNLSNANFIYNKAIFANATTPAHFNSKAGDVLPNGLPRNFSALENNPYYLLHNNRDTNTSSQGGLFVSDTYTKNNVENTIRVVSQFSDIKNTAGNIPFAAQVSNPDYNERTEKYSMLNVSDAFKYTFSSRTRIGASLDAKYQNRLLNREYGSGYTSLAGYPGNPAEQYTVRREQNRFETGLNVNASHELQDIFYYNDDDLRFEAGGGLAYSSTVKKNVYGNATAGFVWNNFITRNLSIYGHASYKAYEPDLQNNNLYFNSLAYRIDQFKQMGNNYEIFTPNTTSTTKENNYTAGVRYDSRVDMELELYRKNVKGLYAPLYQGDGFAWLPAVDYYQKGLEFTLNYNRYLDLGNSNRLQLSTNFNFTAYKNEVTGISGNYARIPIAGFADVNKNYIVGQPLGVIMGSAYKRDAYNNIIIDSQGFPEVAGVPKVIGNPNPDFVVGFSQGFHYKKFSLKLNLDWSQGGDLWNGTQQTLNYYGVSQTTANQRSVTGYVFNGVTEAGVVNTQPVSFYDTNLPVTQNRWTRYGVAGVAEDAIEDASYFRLNNITLSYSKNTAYYAETFNITVSAFVNNVFILSKSDTAFAANTLFNSSETTGLDYFNSPMLRMYGLSFAVKF
ncbi:carboxypeptidase-like regulatory domain-containing protein [Flavobacterium sp. RHBU_24]|uniref:carboxypeptidase-like regulatory domain-containing protein n=1 Tax=Flavobacterium sp. RHBU_24 TaxID=3391185 RepID=UPI003985529C